MMTILVDTREQKPFEFEGIKDLRLWKQTLSCGDYSLSGFDRADLPYSIIVERKKSAKELLGNVGRHWERFQKELVKMQEYKTKLILVEGTPNFTELYEQKFTKMHPNFIASRLDTVLLKYDVPILFLGNRENVEKYIIRIFKRNLMLYRDEYAY